MAQKKLHFETLQLHVGQEQPDPTTMQEPSLFIKRLLMYSIIRLMPPPDSN